MASSGKSRSKSGVTAPRETLHPPRQPAGHDALITALGGGTLDFAAMLGIADILPVMIAYVDRDYRYAFVNRPLADWLEQPREAILGKTIADILGEANFEQRRPMLDTALAGTRSFFASEFDYGTRGAVAVQTDYVPWADPSGAVQGVIILVQDVTDHRAADRAVRESEQRFRRIADSAPVPMWVTRRDRKRDFVNQAYVDLMGVSEVEARAIDWAARIHPDDRERMIAETLAGEASRAAYTIEARFEVRPGEWRWMRAVSQPRFGPDGAVSGYIGAATDITLAKQSELELRQLVEARTAELAKSETRFRSVFEAALEVMVLLEPDGTVIAVNSRRELWRHPDPKQALGAKLWDAPTLAAYPQHIGMMREGIAKAARGETFTAEVKMEREGVPTAYLDVSVQPVRGGDGGQEIVYLLFEARDITELKTAQEQLRQSQKMEALGQLTGGIAHDFNNLLTVVVGSLDLIVKRAEDAKTKRYAENALDAAERGARLTGQLLAFSRLQRLEVRAVEVAPLIENMRPLLRNVLGPGIEKRFDLAAGLGPVMADPTQLEVAMLNLAINARDAMPDGGILRFATRPVEIASDPELDPGNYVELTISDTGDGMSEDVRARAFEPFFTTKDVGKGTGLGLSMVYGMARQSGGTARLSSKPGKGAAITLYFRAAGEAGAAGEEAAGATPDEASGAAAAAGTAAASVLVIDDDPDVRAFIAATLEEQGYAVRAVADGRAGLEAMSKARPDVVVLDFIMPGLSGAEVAKRILKHFPGQPILFVSGYSETEAVKAAAPGAPLLAKPFRAEALGQAVKAALAGK